MPQRSAAAGLCLFVARSPRGPRHMPDDALIRTAVQATASLVGAFLALGRLNRAHQVKVQTRASPHKGLLQSLEPATVPQVMAATGESSAGAASDVSR
jgi:hypothetical protein